MYILKIKVNEHMKRALTFHLIKHLSSLLDHFVHETNKHCY